MKQFMVIPVFLISLVTLGQGAKAENALESLVVNSLAVGASAGYSVNNEIIWQSAKGFANKKEGKEFTIDTKLRMASIAKSMTALAVMQLVEQQKIDLDAPIQTYIPDYPKNNKTQITVRHLLSHTSGIGGYKDGKESGTTKEYTSLSEALDLFKNRELLFEPGTRYSYTTYGYTVLGVVVERVSGQTFEDYMRQNIWDKADMANTGIERFGEHMANKSKLYHRNKGKGKPKEADENNLSNRLPGGGFYTTVGDMLKYGNAVLNNVLVKKETLDLMREHHSLEKERNAYGFGWYLYNPKPNEGAIIGHSGAQTGCSAQLFIVPGQKVVVIVLANTSLVEVGPMANELLVLALDKAKTLENR